MNVVSYFKAVPKNNTKSEKTDMLLNFIQGVNAVGDNGRVYYGSEIIDNDVAIIQGWQHEFGKSSEHLLLRKAIIDSQLKNNKYVITADSNLFLYASPKNTPHHYLRYSINGVFPDTGNYCDTEVDTSRWQQISKDLNIKLGATNYTGKNIVLCLQRNGGWSMGKYDVQDWIINTVTKIRKHSDRPIIIRAHPGDKNALQYLNEKNNRISHLRNLYISPFGRALNEDLMDAWAVVNHNSSSIVGPLIQGYHGFVTEPLKSQCSEVTHTNFCDIETPKEFDRQSWLERISMFHWNFKELENGDCWKHMRKYI